MFVFLSLLFLHSIFFFCIFCLNVKVSQKAGSCVTWVPHAGEAV